MLIYRLRSLFSTKEEDNIVKYNKYGEQFLELMKTLWPPHRFKAYEIQFKILCFSIIHTIH